MECTARVLAENAGLYTTEVITQLYAAHKAGRRNCGVDVEVSYLREIDKIKQEQKVALTNRLIVVTEPYNC